MNNEADCFWYSSEGWRYSRGGVKVGPFDRFADAVEDYFEPDPAPSLPVSGVGGGQDAIVSLLTD